MAGWGTGGFALLTSAREMLASASIYNFILFSLCFDIN
jgi:hypothetical protein